MTKKTRSPARQPPSPNPRPKQRNCQTSVDHFFSLKLSTRAKIDEAMSANVATSPSESDNDSNNPYDVRRDDDEDEVLTDTDQKESEDDMMSIHSAWPLEPSKSDYESANDTMSLIGKSKNPWLQRETSDLNSPDPGIQTPFGIL
jgi:hypothetical protein